MTKVLNVNKHIRFWWEIITGCIGFLLFKDVTSQLGKTHSCRQFLEDEVSVANCRQQPELKDVPQDLDPYIKKLDLSANSLSNLEEHQFRRYSKLEELKISAMKASFSKSYYYVFRQLKSIKIMDLSFGEWSMENNLKDPVFYWPPTLTSLTAIDVSENYSWYLDLSNLANLEHLDASQNDLQIFPTFNRMAPLKFLNLNRTNLTRLRVEDLASLCDLQELHLTLFQRAELLTSEKFCECKRLLAWIKDKNIKGTIPECKNRNENCDLNFSENLSNTYQTCLSRNKFPLYLKIIIILIILAIIVAAGVGGYFYWRHMMSMMENTATPSVE